MGKHYKRFVSHRHLELSLFLLNIPKQNKKTKKTKQNKTKQNKTKNKKNKNKKQVQLKSKISCKQMGCSRYWVNENTIEKIRHHYFYY